MSNRSHEGNIKYSLAYIEQYQEHAYKCYIRSFRIFWWKCYCKREVKCGAGTLQASNGNMLYFYTPVNYKISSSKTYFYLQKICISFELLLVRTECSISCKQFLEDYFGKCCSCSVLMVEMLVFACWFSSISINWQSL